MAPLDANKWLETLPDALESYVRTGLDAKVDAATGTNTSNFYEVKWGFPGDREQREWLPLSKTIIHFEMDDIEEVRIGIGDQVMEVVENIATHEVTSFEAQQHHVNLDVGIWTSDDAGGDLALLRARQRLGDLFHGPSARLAHREAVGAEILSWSGGRRINDIIDGHAVFRVLDMELILRVYSRHALPVATIVDTTAQNPALEIEEAIVIDE